MRRMFKSARASVILLLLSSALLGCGHRYHSNTTNAKHTRGQQIKQNTAALEIPKERRQDNIFAHSAYTVSYNPITLTADWVAYELIADETDGPWTRKGLRFVPDPECRFRQADNDDYRNSGYSRGHLAPAGDMKWDSVAMLESFCFTNCIPQDKELNNGRWNQLEMKVRSLAKEYGRVYVVCGPVFLDEDTLRIGHNRVAVPDACFKALLVPTSKGYSAIAFLMHNGGEERSVKECAITVDELETIVGLDFFCNLPDGLEDAVEGKVSFEDWRLR